MELKIRFYHLNLCHCKSKSNLKEYFNNKSLIVYVNHVLIGFLFMSVSRTQYMVLLFIHQVHHQIRLILSLH